MFKLSYELQTHWPPLAWVAELIPGASPVRIKHGSAVETAAQWCCEAVWQGEYSDGGFDETDVIAGSGVRVRGDILLLVSSGSTVDRLQSLRLADRLLVSNSLVCLLAEADASLQPSYRHYAHAFYSVIKGIDKYVRSLPCSAGEVEMCYFDNLGWDGQSLFRVSKPNEARRFDDFASYYVFLTSALGALVANMRDRRRQTAYSLLGTLSTGYDSTLCTTLARPLGLQQVICFQRKGGRDDGRANASLLGVTPVVIEVDRWRTLELPEVPFIAADAIGEEVHYRAAENILSKRVLITGYHGDKVWDKNTPYTAKTLVRGDMSGMSLSEFRLWSGFIHCPIAFFGARDIAGIKRISNSAEMRPWSVGGDYDRPICRRIIEQDGLPRNAFGTQKSWASRWFVVHPDYLTAQSTHRFLAWLRDQRWDWIRRGRIPPWRSVRFERARLRFLGHMNARLAGMPGYHRFKLWRFLPNFDANLGELSVYGFRRYAMAWAVSEAKRRYRSESMNHGVGTTGPRETLSHQVLGTE